MKSSERRVMLLVDFDNFASLCRQKSIPLDWLKMIERAREQGRVVFAGVFTDFLLAPKGLDVDIMRAGFMLVHVPKLSTANTDYMKDMVDTVITQMMNQAAYLDGVADVVIIASADRDFIVPIGTLRDAGKEVLVMTPTRFENPDLRRSADGRVIYFKEAEEAPDERRRVMELIAGGEFDATGERPEHVYLRSLASFIRIMHDTLAINNGNYSFRALVEGIIGERGVGTGTEFLADNPYEFVKQRLELLIEAGVLINESRDARFVRWRLDLGHNLVRHVCDVEPHVGMTPSLPPPPRTPTGLTG